MKDHEIDRLLRSAAQSGDEAPAEMPFGFDTRVVALWRALAVKPNGIASLLRQRGALVGRSDCHFDVGGRSRAQTEPGTV